MIALIIIVTVVLAFLALIGYMGTRMAGAIRDGMQDLEAQHEQTNAEVDSLMSLILTEVDTSLAVRWDDSLFFMRDVHADLIEQMEGLYMAYSLASKIPGTAGQKDDDSWLGTAPGSHNGRGNGFAREISLQWEAWTVLANRMNRSLAPDSTISTPEFNPLRADLDGKSWEDETFREITFQEIPEILGSLMEKQHARMKEEMFFFQEALREWNAALEIPD
jgi:hypothetical protein